MYIRRFLLIALAVAFLASCGSHSVKQSGTSSRKLLDPSNMDTTVRPGDNFFQYANGVWLRNNPVPKTESDWGSFNVLLENNYVALHSLLDSATLVPNPPAGSIIQKVGDFYRTGMDSITINKVGIAPLSDLLLRINNLLDYNSLIEEIAIEHTEGIGQLFSFGISPDDKNVTREICQFGQGGLGMPGREYYFDNDARTARIRDAYKEYIPRMLMLMGDDGITAHSDGEAIYNLELALAGASMTRVDMRDPY